MALFSERMGYVQPRELMQIEDADDELRTSIYNLIYSTLGKYNRGSIEEEICQTLWTTRWHQPIHAFPTYYWEFFEHLYNRIMHSEWYVPYDLIEFFYDRLKNSDYFEPDPFSYECMFPNESFSEHGLTELAQEINSMLEAERSGYRLVDGQVTPITNDIELATIEESLGGIPASAGAKTHMQNSLRLLSKRPNPDYLNSVKEAITAAESAARSFAPGKTSTLGDAVDRLAKTNGLHKSLAEAWKRMFGYTCDANGIRHGGTDEPVNLDFAFAKYMLVTCSAFVNYLVEEFGNDG